jgi:hypothetical protein
MHLRYLLSLALSAIVLGSCGSSGGSSGGSEGQTPNQNGQDLGGGTGSQTQSCETAWTTYVKTHPTGLKLKYETSGSGHYEIYTNEVTSSSDAAVTESHRSTSGSNESTVTKDEFLSLCKQGSDTPTNTHPGDIEETKKTTIRVRAGEFNTTYIRIRHTLDPENGVTAVSEVWNSEGAYNFLVKQITTTDVEGTRYEVKTELIEAKIP